MAAPTAAKFCMAVAACSSWGLHHVAGIDTQAKDGPYWWLHVAGRTPAFLSPGLGRRAALAAALAPALRRPDIKGLAVSQEL